MFEVEVKWYNDFDEEEVVDHMIVCAASYDEAVKCITEEVEYIDYIHISQIHSGMSHVVYVPEECMNDVVVANTF